MRPLARQAGLIVQEVLGETLVYDRECDRARCLGPTLSWIWRHCDGTRTVADIAVLLRKERQVPIADEVVWVALRRLSRARLLTEPVPRAPREAVRSRRELLQKVALVGGLSLLSISAPTAAQAATCIPEATCEGVKDKTGCTSQPCCDPPLGRICCKKGCKKFCCCQFPADC